jgi:nucleoside-diphosphate-sugar epimerase
MGVRRFVHISSMSVHGPAPDATATSEDTATISRYNESYCDAKAEEEEIVQRAIAADRLSAVILRPTVVYGPRSPFVKQIVAEAKTGTVTVFDEGSGVCNAVCVDDVCAAIGAALIRDEALGQAMFINADRAVTWRDFINAFSQCVHPEPRVENLSSSAALQWWAAHPPAGSQGSGGVLGRVRSKVAAIAAARGPAPEFPPLGRVMRETVSVEFSNARAKNLLAWSPAVSFSQGVIATRQWLEASNLLD